ncbi:hypothetical protein B5G50_27910 [Brevibacillus brevis]|nr:hypothetical protein B5G50_27910 [Brevibacillus brevis]
MLKDSLEKNPDTEDRQQLLEYVEAEETFTEHIDRIGKQYLADVELVDRIADPQIKLNVIQEYLNLQSTLFKQWRDNTESILLFQRGFINSKPINRVTP